MVGDRWVSGCFNSLRLCCEEAHLRAFDLPGLVVIGNEFSLSVRQ